MWMLFTLSIFESILPDNAHHPFEAVVYIEGTKYGRGQAQSKKVARLNAGELFKCTVRGVVVTREGLQ